MLLLLHLVRGAYDFSMSFDKHWMCAFVDSVGDGGGWGEDGGDSNHRGNDDHVDHDHSGHIAAANRNASAAGMPSAIDAAGKTMLEVVRNLKPSEV